MQHLYRHFNKDGALLYVGVSISATARLAQHKETSHWFSDIASVTIEKFNTREEVLQAERDAITNENPIHNLKRPSKPEPQSTGDTSRTELLARVVKFNPMYSISEAAGVLNVGETAVKRWIAAGKLGHVVAGYRTRITGWQLIEFIEHLEDAGRID